MEVCKLSAYSYVKKMRNPVQKRALSIDYKVIREGNKCGCEYWTKSACQGKDKTTELLYELKGTDRRKMEGFLWWLRGKESACQ